MCIPTSLKTAAPACVDTKKVHVKEGSPCPSSASHRQPIPTMRSARKRVAQSSYTTNMFLDVFSFIMPVQTFAIFLNIKQLSVTNFILIISIKNSKEIIISVKLKNDSKSNNTMYQTNSKLSHLLELV
jgi:hypothetical protein